MLYDTLHDDNYILSILRAYIYILSIFTVARLRHDPITNMAGACSITNMMIFLITISMMRISCVLIAIKCEAYRLTKLYKGSLLICAEDLLVLHRNQMSGLRVDKR